MALTDNAKAFIAANKLSPVVSGAAVGEGGEGATYRLKNGRSFLLTADECREIGHPRWSLPGDGRGSVSRS